MGRAGVRAPNGREEEETGITVDKAGAETLRLGL